MVTASVTLYLPSAEAQNPPLKISDEGSLQGLPVFELDCSGTGISCSHSGITGTIAVDKADFSNDGDTAGANRTLGNNDNFDLGLETGGITRLHVEGDGVGASAGNVGIGTTNPSAQLHTVSTTEQLRLGYDGSNYSSFTVENDGDLSIKQGASNFNLRFEQYAIRFKHGSVQLAAFTSNEVLMNPNGTDKDFRVKTQPSSNSLFVEGSTGNVGIGTDSPSALLHVAGDIFTDQYANNAENTLLGIEAMGAGNNTAGRTVAIGFQALKDNTTGENNSAVGWRALQKNTTGFDNTAIGRDALFFNVSGARNMALGSNALYYTQSGFDNVGMGAYSLYNNTSGVDNVAVGTRALDQQIVANHNIGIGRLAGRVNGGGALMGSSNVFIGDKVQASGTSVTNEIVIGATAIGNGSNSVTLGNNSISKTVLRGNVGIGTTSPTSKLEVAGDVKIDNGATSCLMIRDTDDAGWTECFALDGVMSCTVDADGVCDGA
jgi:hypothetical protein